MKLFAKYLAFATLFLLSCEGDEKTADRDKGYSFFPLRGGMFAVYDIDQVTYSQLSEPLEESYELRVEVTDSFPNAEGGYTYVMRRSQRRDVSDVWEYIDTWSARSNSGEAVLNEGNIPYVKLSFPLLEGSTWDGNRRNNEDEDLYIVTAIDENLEINGLTFERTVTVEQEAYDDQVTRKDIRKEIYADGVGLISREITKLFYCTDPVCLEDRIIESGIVFQQVIKDYGIE